jgi:cytoskeletal protein CcmA (bactofilin family)
VKNDKKRKPICTIIGSDVSFEGILCSQEAIRIDGSFKGRIECESILLIGETGKVEGDLVAQSLLIAGELIGNATLKSRLEIRKNGKLFGDICTEDLVMEPGVVFEGKCRMSSEYSLPSFFDNASFAALTVSR